jgi:hypothetical protein
MIELIERIPSAFWGVVAGSFFSILGVWLANRSSDERLFKQLDYDREVKEKERELTLKKDVYLSAAEAISLGISVTGNFANFEMHDEAVVKPYSEKSSIIAKVHIIGGLETIKALNNLTNELSSIYFILFAERAKITKDKVDKDILLKNIEYYSRQRDGTLEMMKQFNLDGSKDHEKWKVLQNNYQFESDYVQNSIVQHGVLSKRFSQKQLIFMKQCIEYSQKASALIPPLLLAVRKELDLPLDEGAYQRTVNEGISKQLAAVDKFMRECADAFELSDATLGK